MAYKIIAQGGSLPYGIKYYQCDTIEDLLALPKNTSGCKAYITDTKQTFILNNSLSWVDATERDDIKDLQALINTLQVHAYKFKGSIDNYADLDTIINPNIGDVYNIKNMDGMNYAYTGTDWDALGQWVDSSLLATKQELSDEVTTINTELNKKYVKSKYGIPESDLNITVQNKLIQSGFSNPDTLMPGQLFLNYGGTTNIPALYATAPGALSNLIRLTPEIVSATNDGYLSKEMYASILDDQHKLTTIERDAQVNKIESISLNGTAQIIDNNKNVNIISYVKPSAGIPKTDLSNDINNQLLTGLDYIDIYNLFKDGGSLLLEANTNDKGYAALNYSGTTAFAYSLSITLTIKAALTQLKNTSLFGFNIGPGPNSSNPNPPMYIAYGIYENKQGLMLWDQNYWNSVPTIEPSIFVPINIDNYNHEFTLTSTNNQLSLTVDNDKTLIKTFEPSLSGDRFVILYPKYLNAYITQTKFIFADIYTIFNHIGENCMNKLTDGSGFEMAANSNDYQNLLKL